MDQGVTMAKGNGAEGLSITRNTTPSVSAMADPPGILRNPDVTNARKWNTDIPKHLPHEKVFPIQIGTELFRLSGASLSSDGKCSFPLSVHFDPA